MGPIFNHIYPFKRKAEGDVIIETGVMWSQAKECRQPPEARTVSPVEPLKGV